MTKVLVIDDEAPIRLLCRVNLEAERMDVIEAADGPSGVEKARNESPDVILLDVMMPGLDGWNVAQQLLEDANTSGIPIIFLTARAEFRDRARGLDIGGVDYITKPFNPLELAPLVQRLLDRIDQGEREVGRHDARAAVADERAECVADADAPEPRTQQDRAVSRAREPAIDDPLGCDARRPRQVLAEHGPAGPCGDRAARDGAVGEVLAAHHVSRVRSGGPDEVEVDPKGREAVALPDAVHRDEE